MFDFAPVSDFSRTPGSVAGLPQLSAVDQTVVMRLRLTIVLAAAIVALPASAAALVPARLVLHQSDVPPGFRLDRDNSGVRSNAREGEGDPQFKALIARAGRVIGYENQFDRPTGAIGSRVDIFRTPRGAGMLPDWFDDVAQKEGGKSLDRRRTEIGDEGWVWHSRPPGAPRSFTFVAWRYGRVFAGVMTALGRERTLALARTQQRRIVTALR